MARLGFKLGHDLKPFGGLYLFDSVVPAELYVLTVDWLRLPSLKLIHLPVGGPWLFGLLLNVVSPCLAIVAN